VSDPVIVRIVRPYRTIEEYLDAESSTIDRRGMLLVDAEAMPPETLVRFIVTLESGEALIKAEGRVKEHIAPQGSAFGGLKVRFKRFGGVTKQFIDRAVQHRVASRRPPPPEADVESSRQPTQVTESEISTPDAGAPPPPPANREDDLADAGGEESELSGIRHRPNGEIEPPPNRDELLDKLRERARKMTDAKLASFTRRAQIG
jgi:hypothetical protein